MLLCIGYVLKECMFSLLASFIKRSPQRDHIDPLGLHFYEILNNEQWKNLIGIELCVGWNIIVKALGWNVCHSMTVTRGCTSVFSPKAEKNGVCVVTSVSLSLLISKALCQSPRICLGSPSQIVVFWLSSSYGCFLPSIFSVLLSV